MNRIKKIEPYKSRFKLKLDHGIEFLLYPGELKKFHLTEEADISENQFSDIMQILYKRAKERALYLLDHSYQTEKQIRDKLKAGFYPDEIIAQVLTYLKEYHLVDDYQYACIYIDYKRKKKSRKQIEQDLYVKGVPKDLIERALGEADFTNQDSITTLVEKRMHRYDLTDKKEFHKFYRYLLGKGYSYDEIQTALRNLADFEL